MGIEDSINVRANILVERINSVEAKVKEIAEIEEEISKLTRLQHQHQGADIRFNVGRQCDPPIVELKGLFTVEALEEIIAVFTINRNLQNRFNT